ncbi:MAG: heme-copper oxidase subunit III [Anaerolineae bacterium]|nr:heme-copper oxidase subunit III [Anaerolineae bacterium]
MSHDVAISHGTTVDKSLAHGDVPEAAHVAEHSVESSNENSKFAMWLFLASEVMFFTVLIAAYILVRFRPNGLEEHHILNIPLTSLNTFLLLASSFAVVRALAAIQIDDRKKFLRSLALVGVLGVIFLAIQAYEYSHLGSEGLTLSSGPFGTAFFTLTGFHGFHVLIGVIWLFKVFWNAFNGKYTKDNHFGVEFFGLYWHFVDVVWILIFTIVYLI